MKGQMFIIAAVFMIVGMVLIKNMLNFDVIDEQKNFIESQNTDKQMENILNEYKYAANIALVQPQKNVSGLNYMSNLSLFLKKDIKYFSSLYMFAYANTTTGKISVAVGNFLSGDVNITLNATDSSPLGYSFLLSDTQSTAKEFTYNGGTSEVNITINYTIQSQSDVEMISIIVKNYTASYFDIRLYDKNIQLRAKESYNRTLQVMQWTI